MPLITQGIEYGSAEAVDFFKRYMALITCCAEMASFQAAKYTGKVASRALSTWYLEKVRFYKREARNLPEAKDSLPQWFGEDVHAKFEELMYLTKGSPANNPVMNMYLQVIPPTGSISYLTNSTPGVQPATDVIET